MQNATTAGYNTAIGNSALLQLTTGSANIAIGQQAGSAITTGFGNIVIASTGYSGATGITTGSGNVLICPSNGNSTGITTGSNNVVIGKATGLTANAINTITLADGAGNIRIQVNSAGKTTVSQILNIGNAPVYIDNTAALAGGLVVGDVYKTALGVLMITY